MKIYSNAAKRLRQKNGATLRTIMLCAAVSTVTLWCGCTTDSLSDALGNEVSSLMTYYTLSVGANSGGSASVSRATYNGNEVNNPKETRYRAGTEVSVRASANSGYRFTKWSGADTSTSSYTSVTMNGNKTLTANFERLYTLSTSANPPNGGSVWPYGNSSYTARDTVNVSAEANPGYYFTGWSGASSSSNSSVSINMNRDVTLTANFRAFVPGDQFSLNPNIDYSSFTDARDGQTYKTVEIGSYRWMAENLNYKPSSTSNNWCYNDNPIHCKTYGRLYTWDAAMSACPVGWRLPDNAEWNNLVNAVGGSDVAGRRLRSAIGLWVRENASYAYAGTDDFGFSALPGGSRSTSGYFNSIGSSGSWWSAAESERGSIAYCRDMSNGYNYSMYEGGGCDKGSGVSVRCVEGEAYALTVNVGSSGGGTVTPARVNTAAGMPVNITATPTSGYTFVGWSVTSGTANIADPKSAATTVTLSGDATVAAEFQRAYTLTLTVSHSFGGGTVSPAGRSSVAVGTPVTITATPFAGCAFSHWTVTSGTANIANPDSASTTVTLSGDATINADFTPSAGLIVKPNNAAYGTVSPASWYGRGGTTITITATPASGYAFQKWIIYDLNNPWYDVGVKIANSRSATTTVTAGVSTTEMVVTAIFRLHGETVTDPRDGQKYYSLMIGTQTWMSDNINYITADSWCYNNSPDSCAKYGRLYTWEAAMTACPPDWHLPTSEEWDVLVNYAGGRNRAGKWLKSPTGWEELYDYEATDEYGFLALPGGYRYYNDGSFSAAGNYGLGYWWSATEGSGDYAYSRFMRFYDDDVYEDFSNRSDGFSVRCVKD